MRRDAFFLVFLVFLFGLVLFGCKKEPDKDNGKETKPTISVSVNQFKLKEGETATIEPSLSNTSENLKILFSSEDPDVATVDENGVIVAIGEGETTVTVSLEEYPDVKTTVTVVVEAQEEEVVLAINGPDSVYVGQTIQLTVTDPEPEGNIIYWDTKDQSIISVTQTGIVTGLKGGTAVVRVISGNTGESVEKTITVLIPDPESLEIGGLDGKRVTYNSVIRLVAKISPQGATGEIEWESYDEDVCVIDETGKIQPLRPGEVTIRATIKNTNISGEITFAIEPTLLEFLEYHHNEDPHVQDIRVYGFESGLPYHDPSKGAYYYNLTLLGSVNNYLNYELQIIESILGANKKNRPGTKQSVTKYITVHDTGSAAPGAGASAHNGYIHGGAESAGASWHYTVGNDGVYHHIPDDEVAWHAGDGTSVAYEAFDSGIPYTIKKKPEVTITPDGYYALDGVRSNVQAPRKNDGSIPKTSEINTLGIEVTKGENGNWFIGKTWWSNTYKYIGNRGGNNNSIGIESCVNQGSDVFLTWQLLAKLVAKLMEENGLYFEHVVQHHYFSGKDCPMTMRNSSNFERFMKLVEAEYFIRTMFNDYTIRFISNNPDYIDNRGRIIDLPVTPTRASYTVEVTNTKTNKTEFKLFYVNLPAKSQ